MKNKDFYEILDADLESIVKDLSSDLTSKLKQDQQKKSYAFLVWFLNFYANISNVEDYITDGHGDNSCDIILDKVNSQGDKVFYIVQSKWNVQSNCEKFFESDVLKSYLSDVQSLIRGDKSKTENILFNQRYDDLLEHVRNNGEVKAVCLTLKNMCVDSDSNIKSFESVFGRRVLVDVFDINRLKLDYIDRKFKKSIPPNPLEKVYNPEFENIKLSIVRDDDRNFLKINRPFEAHVFNVLPRTIYELVDRFGVSLFDKNVRNPLVSSSINKEIVNSLINNPSYFWYYNNGITAISRAIPNIGAQAESFEVTGLQIINGAQTAYSIYRAYSEATFEQRAIIDAEARVTFRLLKSGGKDFDLKVTKYTNSQNPVSDRDFWSSDIIQKKIQNYFYGTNVWYEKRSGEFRETPKEVDKISNSFVAIAHLSFWLLKPTLAVKSFLSQDSEGKDLIFTSYKEDPDGLYETIFNEDVDIEDFYASFCVFDVLTDSEPFRAERIIFTNGLHLLALTKLVIRKYLDSKYNSKVNLSNYVIEKYKNEEKSIIKKCLKYASDIMKDEIESIDEENKGQKIIDLMTKNSHFEILLEKVERIDIDYNEIERLPEIDDTPDVDDEFEAIEDELLH